MKLPDHPYRPLIEKVCEETPPVPPDVLEAMMLVESNFDPKARSTSDARGLLQLIPRWHASGVGAQVARWLGKPLTDELWYDPQFNVRAGALHLRWCYTSDGSRSWERAVRKYHSGSADPPPGFVDGQGTSSDHHIAKFRKALSAVQDARQTTEDTDMATHRFVLSAGHRNTDRGGAWRGPESAWTYPICVKLKKAIERRGGKAWIIQEEDGDNDPTFCVGRGLQNAARLCVDLAKAVGGVDAYISMHYGAEPVNGFFTIYPDAHNGVDVAANNPLDIQLSQVFAKHVKKTGMPIRGDGTMSERRSGVGLQGYRLGEFVGTLGFRDKTARVIVEAGNSLSDAEYNLMWSAQWQDRYVEALVDGLEEVFGTFKGGSKPDPKPDPKPTPQYAAADPIPALKDERPFLTIANGATFVRADLVVKATRATPRLKYADPKSEHIGPLISAGETFAVDYLCVNPDGSLYWYTPWATRVAYEDTEIIEADQSAAA